MTTPEHIWKWVIHGFTGLVGMLVNCDRDLPPVSRERLDQLREFRRQIDTVITHQETLHECHGPEAL